MPSRSLHNLFNAWAFGFSGNEIHQHMDRWAKTMRQNHRKKGHGAADLAEMIILFRHKYTPKQVTQTYLLHKAMDGAFSGFSAAVKDRNKNYGKKHVDTMKIINALKKEVLRI